VLNLIYLMGNDRVGRQTYIEHRRGEEIKVSIKREASETRLD